MALGLLIFHIPFPVTMSKLSKYFLGCLCSSALSQNAVSHPKSLLFNYNTGLFQLASAIKNDEKTETFLQLFHIVRFTV